MSEAVKVLCYYGPGDCAIRIDGLHTVDYGPISVGGPPDFVTRDGYPMSVMWEQHLGFLVAVRTS